MSVRVHPAAFVDPKARLGVDVCVGPGTVIGPDVTVGDHTVIDAHVLLTGWTTVGRECRLHHAAVAGSAPQDLKYSGEPSYLAIGDRTVLREFVTANLATDPGATTRIGDDCLLMAYAHVAHNCAIGDRVIVANAVQFAGYVTVEDWAIVGGGTVVHQFVRIGAHAMIGGGSRIAQDVAPYVKLAGSPPRLGGVNTIGLERRGFAAETVAAIEDAYRLFFRKGLTVPESAARIRADHAGLPEVEHFVRFCETSVRGITR